MALSYQDAYAKIKSPSKTAPVRSCRFLHRQTPSLSVRSTPRAVPSPSRCRRSSRRSLSRRRRAASPPADRTYGRRRRDELRQPHPGVRGDQRAAGQRAAEGGARKRGGRREGGIGVGGGGTVGSTGDVTISGFPPSGTQGSRIYVNAGVSASAMLNSRNVTPAVETFPIGITVHGQLTYQHIAILRPPVLGIGAFTIPALPVAIIFAPPQGQLAKNSNTFTDKVTVSTTTTVSISTETDTKSAQAYTAADLAGKVSGLLTQIAGLIAGAGALTTTGGGSASLINVISGPPGGGTLTGVESAGGGGSASFGDVLKGFSAGYGVLGDILSGFGTRAPIPTPAASRRRRTTR